MLNSVSTLAQNLDSLELILNSHNEKKDLKPEELLKAYDNLSWGYLSSDFEKSVHFGEKGLKLSHKENDKDYIATFTRNLGVAYYMSSQFDIAEEYLNEALDMAQKIDNHNLEGRIYGALGNLYNRQSQYTLALDYYLKATSIYEKHNNKLHLGRTLSNIGVLYQKLLNFDQALNYFYRAADIANEMDDKMSLASIYISLSDINIDIDKEKAINYAEEAILIFKEFGNRFSEVDAMLGLAKIYYSTDDFNIAQKVTEDALQISKEMGAPFLISQSYVDLSNIYYYQKKYALSEQAAIIAWENDSTDINLTNNILYNITRANIYLGNSEKAETYLYKLRDKLEFFSNSEYQNALSELEVKYETEKKELKIMAMENEKRLNRMLVTAIVALLLFALSFFVVRHRLSRQRQKLAEQKVVQLQKENQLATVQAVLDGETAERSRLAKDLHDGLGSMLSVVKYNLPEMKTGVILEKESVDRFRKAVDMLDSSIQELRRVAHHMMPESLIRFGLKASLADFCDAIPNTHFHYYGNEERLSSKMEILIYRSVHELVNNAHKHSEADKIDVQIIQEWDRLSLVVQDNGKGFDSNTRYAGMGLENIKERVESYGGKMFISSATDKGTEIHIELRPDNKKNDNE